MRMMLHSGADDEEASLKLKSHGLKSCRLRNMGSSAKKRYVSMMDGCHDRLSLQTGCRRVFSYSMPIVLAFTEFMMT